MDRGDGRRKHRRALERIAANPQAFIPEIDHPVDIGLEITLPENGEYLTETDIKLIMKNGDLYLIEYKNTSRGKHIERARQQLERARGWYRRHEGISPDHIFTRMFFGDDPKYTHLFEGI